VASGYHQIAFYSEAATRYEQFARKYPGEAEAADGLSNAYKFRVGLKEYDAALNDLRDYIRFYGARKPAQAADVFFQMGEVYEKENRVDEHIRHLEMYLKQWAKKGSVEKEILAHFKLGQYYWAKSCPNADASGSCIKMERVATTGRQRAFYEINRRIKDKKRKIKEPLRQQCGPPTKSKITVIPRTRNFAKTAQTHFGQALRIFANGAALKRLPQTDDREARANFAINAAAGSRFYQGEQVYEQFLALSFPSGLQLQAPTPFDTPRQVKAKKKRFEQDKKRLMKYMTDKGRLAERLAGPQGRPGIYDSVLAFNDKHWFIAASARLGQVWANFKDQLYTAPIPKELKEQNQWGVRERELFCDELVDLAEPIETKSVTFYETCLKGATRHAWFNEWSGMCETELNQMAPSDYPLAAVERPRADYVTSLMTPASVVPELASAPATVTAAATAEQ